MSTRTEPPGIDLTSEEEAAERVATLLRETTREMVLAASQAGQEASLDEHLIAEAMRVGAATAAAAELSREGRLSRLESTVDYWTRYTCRLIDRIAEEVRRLFRAPLPLAVEAALAAAVAVSRRAFMALGGW